MSATHNYFSARRHLLAGYHRKIKLLGSFVVAPQTCLVYIAFAYLHPCWQAFVLAAAATAMSVCWLVGFHLNDAGKIERGVPLVAVPGFAFLLLAYLLRENRGIAEAVAALCMVVYVSVFTQRFLVRAMFMAMATLLLGLVIPLFHVIPQMPTAWYEQLAIDIAYVVAMLPVVYYFLGGSQAVSETIFQESETASAKRQQVIETIRRIEPMLATAISTIEETTFALASRAAEQSDASAQVNRTSDQLVALVARSIAAAVDTQGLAIKTQVDAQSSQDKLVAVEKRFQEAVSRIESVRTHIEELAAQIALTETVNRAMGEIADSLAVLTVNASLEAAIAGEHGRGFAVVAQELRRLISQTGADLHSSRKLLADIRFRAADIARDAEHGTAQLRSSYDELRDTAQLAEIITQGFIDTTTKVGAIAETAALQQDQISAINSSMHELEAASRELETSTANLERSVAVIVSGHAELRRVIADDAVVGQRLITP